MNWREAAALGIGDGLRFCGAVALLALAAALVGVVVSSF